MPSIIQKDFSDILPVSTSHHVGLKTVLLSSQETSSSLTQIAITELHKGDFVDTHVHPTMDEHYYFMEGEGLMMIVDEKYICKAGTYLLIPAGYRHSLPSLFGDEIYDYRSGFMKEKRYFNVRLEFDKRKLEQTIENAIKEGTVGYVCSVESNNLTVANNNSEFLNVLNGALVNNCDGSVLAKILGYIHHEPLESYIGADIFIKYVRMCQYRQFFLGNTQEVLSGLKDNLSKIDPEIKNMRFETLPFRKVDEFDYQGIAQMINEDGPDIIWVSLGAPKQEMFMNRLQPYLHRGVMFGFGAIFNFNAGVGNVRRAPNWMLKLKLEWLHRAFEDPKKNVPRYWNFIKTLPRLIKEEMKRDDG